MINSQSLFIQGFGMTVLFTKLLRWNTKLTVLLFMVISAENH